MSGLEEAQSALATGNTELAADILLKLKDGSLANVKIPSTVPQRKSKATFAAGKTTESDLTPFTAYWDDHLWKLDIHIPLTIFDVDWINTDLLVAVKRSSKSITQK